MSNTRIKDLNELKALDAAELNEVVGGNGLVRRRGSRQAPQSVSSPNIFDTGVEPRAREAAQFALVAAPFKNGGGNYN